MVKTKQLPEWHPQTQSAHNGIFFPISIKMNLLNKIKHSCFPQDPQKACSKKGQAERNLYSSDSYYRWAQSLPFC